jgi:hypothetical protein
MRSLSSLCAGENDGNAIYQAEEELHQAEQARPPSDGLLLVLTSHVAARGFRASAFSLGS